MLFVVNVRSHLVYNAEDNLFFSIRFCRMAFSLLKKQNLCSVNNKL